MQIPTSIRLAAQGTLLAAALQIMVGILLWMHRADFALAQHLLHPDLAGDALKGRVEGIVYGGLGTHLILAVVYVMLARAIAARRKSARVRLTFLLVVASIGGTVAVIVLGDQVPLIRTAMRAVQLVSTTLRLGVIGLLWLPQKSRAFFDTAT